MEDTTNTNQDQNPTTHEPELTVQSNPGEVDQNKIPESEKNHNDEKKEENDEKNTEVQDQLDAKRTSEETIHQESTKETEQNPDTKPTIIIADPTEDKKIDHDQHLAVEADLSSNSNPIGTIPLETNQEQSNSDESPKLSSGSNSPLKDRHPKLQNLKIHLVPMDNEVNPDSPSMQKTQLTQQEIEGSQPEPNLSKSTPQEKKEDSESKSNNEESKDRTNSPSKVQPQTSAPSSSGKISLADFHRIASLGRGSYAEVFLVKKINTGKHYALKAIDKNFMKKENKQHQVYVEREVLRKLDHPNIIKLYSSFQDRTKLYFVLEYVGGGEFSDYLRVYKNLNKEQIKFFSAEIVNILEHLFKNNIAHRDLKPENLLLTNEGHLKAIDFGTAKFLDTDKRTSEIFQVKKEDTVDMDPAYERSHRKTFVGTAQYVSPEMLEDSDCGAAGDIWALGCMIYQMEVGEYPFDEANEYLIFERIKAVDVKYPPNMDPEVKDIVQKILVKEPEKRLGAGPKGSPNDFEALKAHPLFAGIDFANLHQMKPPIYDISSPYKKKRNASGDEDDLIMKQMYNYNLMDRVEKAEKKAEATKQQQQQPSIQIILSGLVLMKDGWFFYKARKLVFTNEPKLCYFDPETGLKKGEIQLVKETKAVMDSSSTSKFSIQTPKGNYTFKEVEHSAQKWCDLINETIKILYEKK